MSTPGRRPLPVSLSSLPGLGGRGDRPTLGGVLIVVAGILMLLVTWQFTLELLAFGNAFTVIGFIFGALVVLTGVLTIAAPELSTPLGITAIALSILGIIGALGGLLFGTVIGIVGGSLAIAWQPEPIEAEGASSPPRGAGGTSDQDVAVTAEPHPGRTDRYRKASRDRGRRSTALERESSPTKEPANPALDGVLDRESASTERRENRRADEPNT